MPRKQKNIHYTYKTTCDVTKRYYVGMHSTNNLDDGYMGSGKRLRYSIRKYGEENHTKEILEFFETRELLVEAEKKIITEDMIDDERCMNLVKGGGGFTSEYARECVKKSIAKQKILRETNPDWVEHKRKTQSNAVKMQYDTGVREKGVFYDWTGRKHSPETKEKMSKPKNQGEKNSQYGTCWITKDGLNKKIKKEELDTYLTEGWVKGRKL
jgi:hypothetical protein